MSNLPPDLSLSKEEQSDQDAPISLRPIKEHVVSRTETKKVLSHEESLHQLQQEALDAKARRHRDIVLFYVAIGLLIAISSLSIVCLASKHELFSPEERKWATTVLTAIVSGLTGYLTGKLNK